MPEEIKIVVVIEDGMVRAIYTNNPDPEVMVVVVDYDETDERELVKVQDDYCSVMEAPLIQDEDFVSAVMEVL
jgi:hypothetical protein